MFFQILYKHDFVTFKYVTGYVQVERKKTTIIAMHCLTLHCVQLHVQLKSGKMTFGVVVGQVIHPSLYTEHYRI